MSHVTLDDSKLEFQNVDLHVKTHFEKHTSLNLTDYIYSNGASKFLFNAELVAISDEQKGYLRSVINANLVAGNYLKFMLPTNIFKYKGDYSGAMTIKTVSGAGGNLLQVEGASGSTLPADVLRAGDFIKIGTFSGIYSIFSYNSVTQSVQVSPSLGVDVTVGLTVHYRQIHFVGLSFKNADRLQYRVDASGVSAMILPLALSEVRKDEGAL